MELGTLVDRLNDRLDTAAYRDSDPSRNGLQVGDRSRSVDHVVGTVDAAQEPIEEAIDRNADLLVVHHGLMWGEETPLTGHRYGRIRRLVEADLALYAAHLPLDGHPTLGNAAVIADDLGLTDRTAFPGETTPIGLTGKYDGGDADELLSAIADALGRDLEWLRTIGPTPSTVDRVAIVTGSGTDYIEAAAAAGADVLITGEGKHAAYHEAADVGLSVVLAGHYATETGGVRSVLDEIEAWGPSTAFLDLPTGL